MNSSVIPASFLALHALVDVQHAVAGWTDVFHVLAGVHAERDQAAGPDPAQRHRGESYSRAAEPAESVSSNVQNCRVTGRFAFTLLSVLKLCSCFC